MKYIIGLLCWVSVCAQGAQVITNGVTMSAGNVPTVSYFTAPGSSGPGPDLYALGMRYFGVGTAVFSLGPSSPNPGGPSPWGAPYGVLFALNNGAIALSPGDTWDGAIAKFLARYPQSGSFSNTFALNRYYNYEACVMASPCVGCGYTAMLYSGSCSTIPWASVSCDITPSSILLNHGSLRADEVNGHVARADIRVTCDSSTYVRFRLTSARIYLGLGITTKIHINGIDMDGPYSENTFNVPAWGLTLPLESRLQATDPQSGQFSGSTVLLVDVI